MSPSPGETLLVIRISYKLGTSRPSLSLAPMAPSFPYPSLQLLSEKWNLQFDEFTGLPGHMG